MNDLVDKKGEKVTVSVSERHHGFVVAYPGEEPVGVAQFVDNGDERIFFHTEVARPATGKGLAGVLVQEALERTAREGKSVVAVCPLVLSWLHKHEFEGTWREPQQSDIAVIQSLA